MIFGILLDFLLLGFIVIVSVGSYLFYSTFKNKQFSAFFKTATLTSILPIAIIIRQYIREHIATVLNAKLGTQDSFNTVTESYAQTLFESTTMGVYVMDVAIPIIFVLVLGFIIHKIGRSLYSHVKT